MSLNKCPNENPGRSRDAPYRGLALNEMLKKRTACSRSTADLIEDKIGDDVVLLIEWLENSFICFQDSRNFDYIVLAEMGYRIVSIDDLQQIVSEFKAQN